MCILYTYRLSFFSTLFTLEKRKGGDFVTQNNASKHVISDGFYL